MDKRTKDLWAIGSVVWGSIGVALQAKDIVDLAPMISPGWLYMTLGALIAVGAFHLITEAIDNFCEKARLKKKAEHEAKKQRENQNIRNFSKPIEDAIDYVASSSLASKSFDFHSSSRKAWNAIHNAIESGALRIGVFEGYTIREIEREELKKYQYKLYSTGNDISSVVLRSGDREVFTTIYCDPDELYRLFAPKV